ncbi:hypothetical protein [Streptomyces sp. RTd22]|uniref:hypothetical protein n=1 Tax=Streptomyces sp. RTd22 TaxID=1841249 RepID=UPI000A910C1C|nr:hypothetical protein [Streptomyces sp. RTd22]
MNQEVEIIEVVDAAVGGEQSSRLEQDAARIKELSYKGFEGPAYETFESELFLELQPIVLGMIGSNKMAQLAQKHSARLGRDFFVHADDVRLLKGSQEARDTLMVEVLAYAMKKFRTDFRYRLGGDPRRAGAGDAGGGPADGDGFRGRRDRRQAEPVPRRGADA